MLEIGGTLREARRLRNLQLSDIERATRIRVAQLEALEQERFELLPPDPYRRAFLREYADFLGLDGDLYASEYDLRFRPPPEPHTPPPSRRRAGGRRRLAGRRPLLRMGAILAVVLVGVAAWQLGRPESGTLTPPPPSTAHTGTQAHPHTHRPATTKPAATRAPALILTAARGSCWLWVRARSTSGPTIYEQTLQPGQSARFGLRRQLWIRIGAPWNLDATIDHRPLTLPAKTGDVLATAAGLRPAS